MDAASITGRTEGHLCPPEEAEILGAFVHGEVVEPFLALQGEARGEGFELAIDSGFRHFKGPTSPYDPLRHLWKCGWGGSRMAGRVGFWVWRGRIGGIRARLRRGRRA